MAFLEINNIVKFYGPVQVLNGVSISMEKGEVITIIGFSGNGKTTLLRALNTLETIEGGEVILNGEQVLPAKKGYKSEFGMVFQSYNLFPQYTALENITLAMDIASKNKLKNEGKKGKELKELFAKEKASNKEYAKSLLVRIGLGDKIDNYPCQLSGGQCQRVAITRALALRPEILCFDEPTSALDPRLTKEVCNIILDLKKEGHTMIIVTHDMDFAKMVSDKVYFMSKGVIEVSGTPSEVFSNRENKAFVEFLGNPENE